MRASREYAAGFGTSGSLLAGAAVLFLIGSAIVAFNGWPQIGTGPATSSVAAAPLALSSPTSRRLTLALAAHRHAAPAGAAGARIHRTAGQARVSVKAVQIGSAPAQSGGATGPTTGGGGSAAGGSSASAPARCGDCQGTGSQGPLTKLTSSVTDTVSNVATNLGNQISGLGSVAAGQVSPVSPPAGGAVSSVTSTAANTVTGTVNTVTNAVNGVLGGGH